MGCTNSMADFYWTANAGADVLACAMSVDSSTALSILALGVRTTAGQMTGDMTFVDVAGAAVYDWQGGGGCSAAVDTNEDISAQCVGASGTVRFAEWDSIP